MIQKYNTFQLFIRTPRLRTVIQKVKILRHKKNLVKKKKSWSTAINSTVPCVVKSCCHPTCSRRRHAVTSFTSSPASPDGFRGELRPSHIIWLGPNLAFVYYFFLTHTKKMILIHFCRFTSLKSSESNHRPLAATQHVHSAAANAHSPTHIAFICPKWTFKIANNCSTVWTTSIDRSRSTRASWSASRRRRRAWRRIWGRKRKIFTRCWGDRRILSIRKVRSSWISSYLPCVSHFASPSGTNIPRSERNKLTINVTVGAQASQRVVKEQQTSSSSQKRKRNSSRVLRSKTYFDRKRAEHRNNNNTPAAAVVAANLDALSDSD